MVAESLIQYLRIPDKGPVVILQAFIIFACVSIPFIIYQVRNQRRISRHMKMLFEELCKAKGISHNEEQMLARLIKSLGLENGNDIFDIDVFDRAVEKFFHGFIYSRQLYESIGPDLKTLRALRKKLGFMEANSIRSLKTTRELMPGEALYVWVENSKFEGKVSDVNDLFFVIEVQSAFESLVKTGKTIGIKLTRRSGMYEAEPTVLDCETSNGSKLFRLEHTSGLSMLQLRNYVRLDWRVPINVYYPADAHVTAGLYRGSLLNISGGGIAFCAPIDMQTGSSVLVDIPLTEEFSLLKVKLEVLEKSAGSPLTRYRGRYVKLDQHQIDNIVAFIFKQEVESRIKSKPV